LLIGNFYQLRLLSLVEVADQLDCAVSCKIEELIDERFMPVSMRGQSVKSHEYLLQGPTTLICFGTQGHRQMCPEGHQHQLVWIRAGILPAILPRSVGKHHSKRQLNDTLRLGADGVDTRRIG
jgi:hypothetical protein